MCRPSHEWAPQTPSAPGERGGHQVGQTDGTRETRTWHTYSGTGSSLSSNRVESHRRKGTLGWEEGGVAETLSYWQRLPEGSRGRASQGPTKVRAAWGGPGGPRCASECSREVGRQPRVHGQPLPQSGDDSQTATQMTGLAVRSQCPAVFIHSTSNCHRWPTPPHRPGLGSARDSHS